MWINAGHSGRMGNASFRFDFAKWKILKLSKKYLDLESRFTVCVHPFLRLLKTTIKQDRRKVSVCVCMCRVLFIYLYLAGVWCEDFGVLVQTPLFFTIFKQAGVMHLRSSWSDHHQEMVPCVHCTYGHMGKDPWGTIKWSTGVCFIHKSLPIIILPLQNSARCI